MKESVILLRNQTGFLLRLYNKLMMHPARTFCPSLESVTINVADWTVELFDIATSAEYERLRPLGYENTHIFFVCFSVVMPSSAESLKTQWLPEITFNRRKARYILVGTQIDLRDDEVTIEKMAQNNQKPFTVEEGQKLAEELKALKYLECSVLTQEGLQELMEEAVHATFSAPKTKRKRKCLIL
ncbi:Cdc42 like protein [Argiope bruennichi]|uniref:Cdc42 like protein n=1 Tax=Argiope bruennichi TaxID=94029 RepID=A0A8T0EDD5_ARGBR|nr:Cdc42 like protein [Argiope bruennichi]